MDRRKRDGNTEQRILQAARRVFVRRGTAGARMQEIAEEAGVNQALLHYYFRSKDRLAVAVFREVAARLIPGVAAVLASDVPLAEKIEHFVHLYIDTVRGSPFMPGYVLAELHHHPDRLQSLVVEVAAGQVSSPQTVMEKLDAQLADEVKAGRIRPIPVQQFLLNLIGLVAAPFLVLPALQVVLAMDGEGFDRLLDERRAELPGFILRALRP
jgi:TetR/AcrR family transcriptional regulator